ncbi:MAG: thiamine pyrophosphate-dependent dehydrogenase E1 component subunit alpha [Myxococcota bacterium]|nr:thiamine pyrophosphate-dependent dehydrogenase E1 component subunit alpha [Myxococcota bacterium]
MNLRYPPAPPPPPSPTPPQIGNQLPQSELPNLSDVQKLLRFMMTSRRVEERTVELYRQNRITGGCYTGIGNEATSVGTALALNEDDVLVPTHRDMGSHLVRGHKPLDIMRQYLKRATSQTGGKDSSLHLGKEGSNIVGMISPLAHMMPVAVGIALAERQRGTPCSVLTTIGDGSTSLGDFHEALNFAAIQKLPILFVIVNNQYAYSTPNTIQYACHELSERANGYGMSGETIDGTDAFVVYRAAQKALERGRNGEGPTLLECKTMRLRGHSEHDDFKYVPPDLLEQWKNWDPVLRIRNYVLDNSILTEDDLETLKLEIDSEIESAISLAESEPSPEGNEAGQDVFRHWKSEWTVPTP